jgi:hypothetical protein
VREPKILGVRLDEPGSEQQAHTRENHGVHERNAVRNSPWSEDRN